MMSSEYSPFATLYSHSLDNFKIPGHFPVRNRTPEFPLFPLARGRIMLDNSIAKQGPPGL